MNQSPHIIDICWNIVSSIKEGFRLSPLPAVDPTWKFSSSFMYIFDRAFTVVIVVVTSQYWLKYSLAITVYDRVQIPWIYKPQFMLCVTLHSQLFVSHSKVKLYDMSHERYTYKFVIVLFWDISISQQVSACWNRRSLILFLIPKIDQTEP